MVTICQVYTSFFFQFVIFAIYLKIFVTKEFGSFTFSLTLQWN